MKYMVQKGYRGLPDRVGGNCVAESVKCWNGGDDHIVVQC